MMVEQVIFQCAGDELAARRNESASKPTPVEGVRQDKRWSAMRLVGCCSWVIGSR